ncbi:hypothetical protein KBC03_07285 [Patescibacteria group bacterium]|nr:hypothetical protein [Patescibacteria group bacterium]
MSFSSFFGLVRRQDESNVAQLYAQTSTMGDVINHVPRYHLFVKVKVSVDHRPVAIMPDAPQEDRQSIQYSFSFFLIPRYFIIIALVAAVLIIRLIIAFFKRIRRKGAQRRLEHQEWLAMKQQTVTTKAPVRKTTPSKTTSTKSSSKSPAPAKKVKSTAPRKTTAKKKPKA